MGSFIALYGIDNSRKLIAEALARADQKKPAPRRGALAAASLHRDAGD